MINDIDNQIHSSIFKVAKKKCPTLCLRIIALNHLCGDKVMQISTTDVCFMCF